METGVGSELKSINAMQRWFRYQASRPAVTALAWEMPDPVLLPGLSVLHRFTGSDIKRFGHDRARELYFLSTEANERIYVAHRQRLKLYPWGFEGRIRRLVESYRLDALTIGTESIIVDVGANIGELGFWIRAQGGTYVGIEPDPKAFQALEANLGACGVYCLAAGNCTARKQFWLSTADADSSLIRPGTQETESMYVDCVSLDYFVQEHGIPAIDLLKIEAEGSEPEVIRGAWNRCLPVTASVALDASPERRGQSPAAECLALLRDAGFSVVNANAVKGRFLLRHSSRGFTG